MIPAPAPGDIVRPGLRIRVLPRAGHLVQVEAAEAFNDLVADFLRR
jgi:pimeloyl-ACP methyl ester carboxylesterase